MHNYSEYNELFNSIYLSKNLSSDSFVIRPTVGQIDVGSKVHKVQLIAQVLKQSFKSIVSLAATIFKDDLTSLYKSPKLDALSKIAIQVSHENAKLNSCFFHLSVGESFVSPLRNIAKRDVLDTEEILGETKQLLEKCRKQPKIKGQNTYVRTDSTPKTAKLDGICTGFRIDIAENYLIKKKSIPVILQENLKGASKEAAANHAVYSILSHGLRTHTKEYYEKSLFKPLAKIDQTKFSHNDVLFVLGSLSQKRFIDSTLHVQSFNQLSDQAKKKASESLLWSVISQLSKEDEEKAGIQDRQIVDMSQFKAFLTSKIRKSIPPLEGKQLQKNLRNVELLVASLEVIKGNDEAEKGKKALSPSETWIKNGKETQIDRLWEKLKQIALMLFNAAPPRLENWAVNYISNASLRSQFCAIFEDEINQDRNEVVCQARQLTRKPTSLSHSSNYSTDLELLDQFKTLPAGFYGLDFDVGSHGHAISYIKDTDDPNAGGYILDPNVGAVKCRDAKHTLKMLKKIISRYPDSHHHLLMKKDVSQSHHRITLWKFEALEDVASHS